MLAELLRQMWEPGNGGAVAVGLLGLGMLGGDRGSVERLLGGCWLGLGDVSGGQGDVGWDGCVWSVGGALRVGWLG